MTSGAPTTSTGRLGLQSTRRAIFPHEIPNGLKFDLTRRWKLSIDRLMNPRSKAILENYRRHANLEVCGLYEQILTPEMTVEHPVY
jgi:hypothetical protein